MNVVALPVVDVTNKTFEEVSNVLLDFYKALGWNGNDMLNVKKAKICHKDYMSICGKLQSLAKDKAEISQVTMFWGNYAPSVDSTIKEGTVRLYNGFISPYQ